MPHTLPQTETRFLNYQATGDPLIYFQQLIHYSSTRFQELKVPTNGGVEHTNTKPLGHGYTLWLWSRGFGGFGPAVYGYL